MFDIADNFGDTNLLVTNMQQGRDLAKCSVSAVAEDGGTGIFRRDTAKAPLSARLLPRLCFLRWWILYITPARCWRIRDWSSNARRP